MFIYKNKTLYKYVNKFYICYLSKNQHMYKKIFVTDVHCSHNQSVLLGKYAEIKKNKIEFTSTCISSMNNLKYNSRKDGLKQFYFLLTIHFYFLAYLSRLWFEPKILPRVLRWGSMVQLHSNRRQEIVSFWFLSPQTLILRLTQTEALITVSSRHVLRSYTVNTKR